MCQYAFAAALLAATLATPAFAQDDAPRGGFHVSGILGYDAPSGDVDDSSGVVYGITATYDANLPGTTGDFASEDDLDGFRLKGGAVGFRF